MVKVKLSELKVKQLFHVENTLYEMHYKGSIESVCLNTETRLYEIFTNVKIVEVLPF